MRVSKNRRFLQIPNRDIKQEKSSKRIAERVSEESAGNKVAELAKRLIEALEGQMKEKPEAIPTQVERLLDTT